MVYYVIDNHNSYFHNAYCTLARRNSEARTSIEQNIEENIQPVNL